MSLNYLIKFVEFSISELDGIIENNEIATFEKIEDDDLITITEEKNNLESGLEELKKLLKTKGNYK